MIRDDVKRGVLGVGITLVFIVVIRIAIAFELSPTSAPSFVGIVLASYIGGLVPGIIAALLVGIDQHLIVDDLSRTIVVNFSAMAIAVIVGVLQRRARMVDTLNGNLERLRTTVKACDSLLTAWDDYSDKGRKNQVVIVRHHISHLATLVFGWKAIRKEMDETQAIARKKGLGIDDPTN